MKKGGVVRFAGGSVVNVDNPSFYNPTQEMTVGDAIADMWGGTKGARDYLIPQVGRKVSDDSIYSGFGNAGETGGMPSTLSNGSVDEAPPDYTGTPMSDIVPDMNSGPRPWRDAAPGKDAAPGSDNSNLKPLVARNVVGPNVGGGGGRPQAEGSQQPGQPGGRQAVSDGALTADDIFKAQMDAIRDRTEDRKSAQERANNDALIAMGAAMMGATGPNALAALGKGIDAGTAARRASEATSRSDFDKNLAARHAVASDLIKQSYYNGTISAKQAHTQQIALDAALRAGTAAAGRADANARADLRARIDFNRQRSTNLNQANTNNRASNVALLRSIDEDIKNQTRPGLTPDPSALKKLMQQRDLIRASLLPQQ